MSALCGFVGDADPATLDAMLARVAHLGDRSETAFAPGVGLGYRWWGGRRGHSPGIHREGTTLAVAAGELARPVDDPAADLAKRLHDPNALATLDGAFAAAVWDGERRRLALARDPFGAHPLYLARQADTLWFASEIKQLLAIPGFWIQPDYAVLHRYLTFSFVPGKDMPIRGVRRVPAGSIVTFQDREITTRRYFELREEIDPALEEERAAIRLVRFRCKEAVARRPADGPVGLYLSGGLDSSGVAVWLRQAGAEVHALSLDFGEQSVEREQARTVAERLRLRHTLVPVGGAELAPILRELVWKLDLPFGDPVTGPQYLLGKAAREAGLTAVYNGEGGDQLFGGWTSKPMISARVYANLYGDDSPEEQYLRSYHRFRGLENELYTPEFRDVTKVAGDGRELLAPHLSGAGGRFLNRVRLADVSLKGSQNILPRMTQTALAWGLDVRAPLFDRALAEASFRLPPRLKLRGACEKYVLKLALRRFLPEAIVWRRKFGMSVPVTDWVLGPLAPAMAELLGPESLRRRGWFREQYVARLLRGDPEPDETRRRRIGERVWTLAMLELWARVFLDDGGRS